MKTSQAKSVALAIAGTDPGGGAGIQADLKTFAAIGVHGYSAITMVIAQNSSSVTAIAPVAPAMIARQVEAVVGERMPDSVKIGALGTAAAVRTVARLIDHRGLPAPVLDPVIMSSAGRRLLDRAGERAMVNLLMPRSMIVTPNLPEAETLAGVRIDSDSRARIAAERLVGLGARAVVIKGGHRGGQYAIDLFFDGIHFVELRAPRVRGSGAHGTGCAFSAAIAAYLARGVNLEAAVPAAKRYVTGALRRSFRLGQGRPILGHLG